MIDNKIIHYVELSNEIAWENWELVREFKFIDSETHEIKSEEVLGKKKYNMIFTWLKCNK
ncbi:hypothetical protein CDV26_03660 [Francisella halioticida]|uniref:Uncharacterized protein n=1 Tax=Francisella halioticida TaxID=549298 RepID=A0ABM6M282_9GAMM|nr:hypothetical protein CDV26_03660 [Francisella halioticida]